MKVQFLNFVDPKQSRYFILTGGEAVLKQAAVKTILESLKNNNFKEKVIIYQDELDQIEEIISRNAGGSLFQENLIVHIKHVSGKFPDKIKSLLEREALFNAVNLALIIESSIEKTPVSVAWIKNIDQHGLIIDCKKLKPMEEKLWLKRQLEFLPKNLLPLFGGAIFQNNEGNLLGQRNEAELLKLLFLTEKNLTNLDARHVNFHSGLSAFELEDVIINKNFQKAILIINFLKETDRQNSAPLIWTLAKIINACLESTLATNKKSALINSGVWSSKTGQYLSLIKNTNASAFMELNEEMLRLDLMNKGLLKADIWEQIENIIVKLQGVTA